MWWRLQAPQLWLRSVLIAPMNAQPAYSRKKKLPVKTAIAAVLMFAFGTVRFAVLAVFVFVVWFCAVDVSRYTVPSETSDQRLSGRWCQGTRRGLFGADGAPRSHYRFVLCLLESVVSSKDELGEARWRVML